MDTSKDYYESVIRNFQTYGRGRSLEQFCRDEAVDRATHHHEITTHAAPDRSGHKHNQDKLK